MDEGGVKGDGMMEDRRRLSWSLLANLETNELRVVGSRTAMLPRECSLDAKIRVFSYFLRNRSWHPVDSRHCRQIHFDEKTGSSIMDELQGLGVMACLRVLSTYWMRSSTSREFAICVNS